MKTIKSSKEITTLEVGDKVVFGDLEYKVCHKDGYYLSTSMLSVRNDKIFTNLSISKRDFVKNLGIDTLSIAWDFPETKSLEALTAIVSALFKEYQKQNELPKTWEEFCEKYPLKEEETFINLSSHPVAVGDWITDRRYRIPDKDRNICISRQEAEAHIALMQLRQLRKCYVGDWNPDWTDSMASKFNITCLGGVLSIFDSVTVHRSMSFPNSKLAKQFFNNFKDLFEIAKPLL